MRSLPDTIEGIGDVTKKVVRNPVFEPRRHAGLSPGHYELWNRIGPETSVRDLILQSSLGPEQAIAYLQQLLLLRAVELGEATAHGTPAPEAAPAEVDDTGDFEIVDPTELGHVSEEERALLAEPVDLEPWEKRRILAAARILRRGDYLELLGITNASTKRELKRAYYQLSKEFHPDRYYGKNLGSFGALLSRIFETASETVRNLAAQSIGPAGPRRRSSERYAFPLKMRVACGSWGAPVDLVAQDISDHGLFVVTTEPARRGDRVEVTISMKTSGPLTLTGRVVAARSIEKARKMRRRPGIGIELDPIVDERYIRVVEAARRASPMPTASPAPQPEPEPAEPRRRTRFARGTGAHDRPGTVLGIDFGTTYTSVSAAVGGNVTLLPWDDGDRAVPSVLAFPTAHETLIGKQARERLLIDPRHTVSSVKRLLGRAYGDRHVEGMLGQAPYDSSASPDGKVLIDMWGDQYAIPQLAAFLLRAARETAERHFEMRIDRVVLTVPVSFTEERVDALRRAARLAQLEVVDVLDEPSAAALANRADPRFDGLVGVYDFGGGTFDFSVVDASAGDMKVLGTSGDGWLGGDDFDLAIANAAANQVWRLHGIDLRERAVEWQHLLFACEQAKRRLSAEERATLFVPEALRTASGVQDLRIRLTRQTCERLWAPLIERSLKTALRGLRRAGVTPSRLSAICLSGGTSYIPAVRQALRAQFGVPVRFGVPPEYAACLGAGVQAAQVDRCLASRPATH